MVPSTLDLLGSMPSPYGKKRRIGTARRDGTNRENSAGPARTQPAPSSGSFSRRGKVSLGFDTLSWFLFGSDYGRGADTEAPQARAGSMSFCGFMGVLDFCLWSSLGRCPLVQFVGACVGSSLTRPARHRSRGLARCGTSFVGAPRLIWAAALARCFV